MTPTGSPGPVVPGLAASPDRGRLADLLDALGGGLLEVLCAPGGLDVPVGEPVLYDPIGRSGVACDDLLLAVGADVTSPRVLDVLELAGRARCSAVALKTSGDPPATVLQAAGNAGVALLAVPLDASWTQLFTLLRTARGALSSAGIAHDGLRVDDLFGLANAIAATLGGATTIEDLQSRVLAYSSLAQPIDGPRQETILGRQVPAPWSRALDDEGVFQRLYSSSGVVGVPGGTRTTDHGVDLRPRLAIAVRAGGEPLGSIWVIEGSKQFAATAEQTLRSAAQIAAMHLLHYRSRANLDRQRGNDSLRALLDGSPPGTSATGLRILPGAALTVLAFGMELTGLAGGEAGVLVDRLAGLLRLHVEAYRGNAHVVDVDRVVYLVLATSGPPTRDRLRSVAEEHRQRGEAAGRRTIRVGIGAPVTDLRRLPESRLEADEVLGVLQRRPAAVAHVDELRGAIALSRICAQIRADPVLQQGRISALAAHDAEKGSNYVQTLHAYLDCFGDVVAAATRLHVHRNTFRYRLARLADIADLDLTDPADRLIATLQLHALAESPGAPPPSKGTKPAAKIGHPAP